MSPPGRKVTRKQVKLTESKDRLRTARIALPGFPRPFDLHLGWTNTIWLTGERNAIARLDTDRKLTVYPRSTGVRPHFIVEHGDYLFTDPGGDAIGSIDAGGKFGEEIAAPPGSRPTSILLTPILTGPRPLLVGAAQAGTFYYQEYGNSRWVPCPHSHVDAIGWGDGMIWYASGSTLQGLHAERLVGGKFDLPEGTRISELVPIPSSGYDRPVMYCDEGRDVIGIIRDNDNVIEYQLPAGTGPRCVTAGPKDHPWFIGRGGKSLFRLMGLNVTEYRCSDETSDLTRLKFSYDERETFWFTERARDCVSSASVYGI